MRILKVSLGFTYFSDALLVIFVQGVLAALTGNANFATPSPTLASISTLLGNFITALANAADGGKTLTAQKNETRALLIAGMRLLASYVEDNGNNNEAILISSGFKIYGGTSSPRPLPGVPKNLRLYDGEISGTVKVKVTASSNTVVYEMRYTEDGYGPDSKWIILPVSTSSEMLISGITPGKSIWVQVRAINSRGVSNWCDPATLVLIR